MGKELGGEGEIGRVKGEGEGVKEGRVEWWGWAGEGNGRVVM